MTDGINAGGRPALFTAELATLRSICRNERMLAESTVRLWAIEDQRKLNAAPNAPRVQGANRLAQ